MAIPLFANGHFIFTIVHLKEWFNLECLQRLHWGLSFNSESNWR